MRNARLDEVQVGIKVAGRNINYLRYADNTTLMAESEEELKSILMKVKEENGKAALKSNIQKTTIRTLGGMTGSKLGKGYNKAVYYQLVYLTYIQSSVKFSRSVVSDSL